MAEVFSLTLPLFGLILIGYLCGRWVRIPLAGLAWMNFFIVYVALPAMFFNLLSRTPVSEFANWRFIIGTTFSTYLMFAATMAIGIWLLRDRLANVTVQSLMAAYSNIGYMGPALTLSALGPAAITPTALIFCFDNALLFALAPLFMSLASEGAKSAFQLCRDIARMIFLHPFIIATIISILAARAQYQPPEGIQRLLDLLSGAAAPCALFVMGVTVALKPIVRMPWELSYLLTFKLLVHPFLVWLILTSIGGIQPDWIYVAVLMLSLPPATNVFVVAQQYQAYVNRASAGVIIGTIVSVATSSLVLYLILNRLIPV